MFADIGNSYEELNTSDVAKLLPSTTATTAKSGKQLIEQLKKKLSSRSFQFEDDDVTVDDNASLDIKYVDGESDDFRNESFQHFCSLFAEQKRQQQQLHQQQQQQQQQQKQQQLHQQQQQQQQQQHGKRFPPASARNNVGNWTMSAKGFLLESKKRKRNQTEESYGVKNPLKSFRVRGKRIDCWKRTAVHVRSICKSRACLFGVYAFLVMVLLASFVGLVLVGGLVVEPFVRGLSFVPAICRTLEVRATRQQNICNCASNCKNYCLNVKVKVTQCETSSSSSSSSFSQLLSSSSSSSSAAATSSPSLSSTSSSSSFVATIYEDEGTLHKQCSTYPRCSRAEKVSSFEQLVGRPGQLFPCWSNGAHPNREEVILWKRFEIDHVIHGMGWSLVTFLASAVLLTIFLRRKECRVKVKCHGVT